MKAVARKIGSKDMQVVLVQDDGTEEVLLRVPAETVARGIGFVRAATAFVDNPDAMNYECQVHLFSNIRYAVLVGKWWEHEKGETIVTVYRHYDGHDEGPAPWGKGGLMVEGVCKALFECGYVINAGLRDDFDRELEVMFKEMGEPYEGGPNSGHTGGGGPPRKSAHDEVRDAIALGRQRRAAHDELRSAIFWG